ncbi:cytochrome P450 [Actinokineospora sp. 24-640]
MNTLTNVLFQLLSNPGQWARLVENPDLAAAAAEEGLRHDSGAQGTTRHALVDVALGGALIPAGARVHLMTGAPGRDPGTVVDPDTFDLDRPDARKHLAFGYGTHFCAGAPLARLELETALRTLAVRFPGMRLASGFTPVYPPGGYMLRGPAELPVVLH